MEQATELAPYLAKLRGHPFVREARTSPTGVAVRTPRGTRRCVVAVRLVLPLGGWSTTLVPHLLIGHFHAREHTHPATEARFAERLEAIALWRWGRRIPASRRSSRSRGSGRPRA